jgi:O-antigen/teichoic acid export membrane protein
MVLGIFNQENSSGIYNAALRLAGLSMLVLTAFNAIFAPVIADLHHRGEMERLSALFKLVTRWVIIVAMPIFLLQMLYPHQLIGLFGKDFASGALALRILSLGTLVKFSTGAVGIMLLMSGHSGLVMFNSLLTLGVALALDFILIRLFGVTGAAVAGMLSLVLVNLVNLGEVWYLLRIHPYDRYTLRPFVAAAPALLGGWLWSLWMPVSGLVALAVASVVVAAIYVAALMLMGWNEDDRIMMAAMEKRFRRLLPR